MRINYIISLYFGPRRVPIFNDPFHYLKKHLEFLQTSKNLEATFIINSCDPELDNKASSLITDFYIRENKGFSYAAWEYGIIKNIDKNYDYFFLIEDDYLPQSPDFYTPFLSKIKDNFYVCELIKDYPCKKHAAISNGLLDAKKP